MTIQSFQRNLFFQIMKLDQEFFNQLLLEANKSPRKRSHYNLHKELDEPVQRLCIALLKGTYVQPHYHPEKNKWELMLTLRGSVNLIIFDKDGFILEKLLLSPGSNIAGVELPPDTWHTIIPATDDAIIIEVKEGPFTPTLESNFAPWAPTEGNKQVKSFLNWIENADVGDRFVDCINN